MSDLTKRALAASLRTLLTGTPLDKLTVRAIAEKAGVSRKTFYYHFKDIYDLLEWSLVDEGKRVLEGHTTAETWQQGLYSVFAYFQENRAAVLNLYRPLQKGDALLERHITQVLLPLLERIFNEQPGCHKVSTENRQWILDFYSVGLVRLFLRWIGDGMHPDAKKMAEKLGLLFSGSMESLIQRCAEE